MAPDRGPGPAGVAYKRAVRRLADRGCRVYAPAMPGFARSADLPNGSMSITGYAAWVDDFMEAAGVDEPALVMTTPVRPSFVFMPLGRAAAEAHGEAIGRSLVRVTAQDQIGLLWAICRWFADHRISIESVHASTRNGVASDTFVVAGKVDADALAAHLSNPVPTATPSASASPRSGAPFNHG